MKKALITGVAGQDGSYLAELLLAEGYEVLGMAKAGSDRRYVPEAVKIAEGDLSNPDTIVSVVASFAPDEIYHLGGITTLKEAYEHPEKTWKVNYESVGVLLEAAVNANPSVRFLQASSSEIFLPSERPLDEASPRDWETRNPYAKAKMMADRDFVQSARDRGAFACSAFLFNHESPRRREDAALRKITRTLTKIFFGKESKLLVGNVDQKRDWGFAGDYVDAMRKMLRHDVPEDFVIATGELHTVKEAIEIAAEVLGMKSVWDVVETSPELVRPTEAHPKVGEISKAGRVLGWKPTVSFQRLIEMMVRANDDTLIPQASMSNALIRFENTFWDSARQTEVFRHTQAISWLEASSGPVLDVGCGDGFFLSLLKKRGINAWGVDISSTAVKRCREYGLEAVECGFDAGVLPSRHAKTAVILDVLEHMYDPKPILQTLHTAVGTLIVSVPNFVSLPARLQVLRGGIPENNTPKKGHVYWYTRKVLEQRLTEAGWMVEEWAYNPPWMNVPIVGSMMRIAVRFLPGLFSLSFVVKAKRA